MAASISLVMTTHNRSHYLADAIESILNQTHKDFELLIWDDGSTDDSPQIARTYAQRDSRIRAIAAPHLGRGLALKAAIAATTGDYLGWIDDDDLLAPTALEETAAVLEARPEIGLTYTNYVNMNEQGKPRGIGRLCQIPYSQERLLVDLMIFHFRLMRRNVFNQVGGINQAFEYAEDYDLCLRLSEATQIHHIAKPLYFYRVHPHSITQQKRPELVRLCQKAINQALHRRGLDQRFELRVQQPEGRFLLCRKPPARSAFKAACLPLALFPLVWAANSSAAFAQRIDPAQDGTGTIVNSRGNQHDITGGQLSGDRANLFHSFERFGLSQGEIANFISRPEIINILGRITGGETSVIDGMLRVTGGNSNLFLMNPAGIVFGSHATLDLPASFTATTATGIGFGSAWFNAAGENNYRLLTGNPNAFAFTVSQPGVIVNAGNLSVGSGQNLNFLGGLVVNTGQLTAPAGQLTAIAVPGQNTVRISQPGNVLSLEVAIAPSSSQPNQWTLPIAALPQLLTSGDTGQNLGLQVTPDGQVALVNSGTPIPTTAGTTIASGRLDVSNPQAGGTGGRVQVLGDRVGLLGAQVDASGNSGGGNVRIGGDYQGQGSLPQSDRTYISRDSRIAANAGTAGNGGRVIIWSNGRTAFYGDISAQGGQNSGNGGFAEVSGRQDLQFDGTVNLNAPQGNLGTLLLDPTNITIFTAGIEENGTLDKSLPDVLQAETDGGEGEETISEANLEALPANANIVLEATNDITVDLTINLNPLVLGADRVLNLQTNRGGSVTFRADADGVGGGDFINPSITINTQGGAIDISGNGINTIGNINSNGGNIRLAATATATAPGGAGQSFLRFDTIDSGGGAVNLSNVVQAIGNGYSSDIFGRTIQSHGGNIAVSAIDDPARPIFNSTVKIDAIQSQGGNIAVSVPVAGNVLLRSVEAGSGNLAITGNEIDFVTVGYGDNPPISISGTGNLTLQPAAAGQPIAISGFEETRGNNQVLNLSDTDLNALQNGFRFPFYHDRSAEWQRSHHGIRSGHPFVQ